MKQSNSAVGYLPEERPGFVKLLLYAIQQVIVMFPATVTVALVTGFQVSTTIFASGLATLCFILITGRKIPLYYGSSFAYLTAIASMCAAEGFEKVDGILPTEAIQYAQFGIIFSGLISIAAGLLVKFFGKKVVETILPASITGPVAMIIGLTLAGNALSDAIPAATEGATTETVAWTVVALVTLLSTILYARYLKGFLGQLPLLLGVLTGSVVAGIFFATGTNLFRRCPGRLPVEAGRRLHLCCARLLPAQGLLDRCGGHYAHCHRHHPRVHSPHVPAGHLRQRRGKAQGQQKEV